MPENEPSTRESSRVMQNRSQHDPKSEVLQYRSQHDPKSEVLQYRSQHDPKSDVLMLTQKSRGQSIMRKSGMSLRGTAQWEAIMRKFSDGHKETCINVPKDLPRTHRNLKKFPTGSTYAGTWDLLGMSGEGTYTFPHGGVVYKGGFDDGMFHGDGELQYECGAVIKGKWHKGKLVERHLFFADGLEYNETEWPYCRPSDRRFTIEYDEGLEPAGRSYLTADQPTITIPPGYYDVGDGFYDPVTKLVYKYGDLSGIERAPREREQQWIAENCRTSPDISVGPCPFLYENWETPTLELPIIRQPDIRCNTNLETATDDDDEIPQHRHTGRLKVDRGQLFTSRIGLCSNTAFYSPGRDGIDSITEINSLVSKKSDFNKESSVAFKEAGYETASKTLTVKAHRPLSTEAVPSDWGLADHSTIKQSLSYKGVSHISNLDTIAEKHDVRAESSFRVPKSTSQVGQRSSHATHPETYKSKSVADQDDTKDIKAEISDIKPELSFKMATSIPTLSRHSGYKQETDLDPETGRSKIGADEYDTNNIETQRSEIKLELISSNLGQQSGYKHETAQDTASKGEAVQYDTNIKVERSEMKPEMSGYKQETALDPETKPELVQYDSNNIRAEITDIKPELSRKMSVNPDQESGYKQETALNPEAKAEAVQYDNNNINAENAEVKSEPSRRISTQQLSQQQETVNAQDPETNMPMTDAQISAENKN